MNGHKLKSFTATAGNCGVACSCGWSTVGYPTSEAAAVAFMEHQDGGAPAALRERDVVHKDQENVNPPPAFGRTPSPPPPPPPPKAKP